MNARARLVAVLAAVALLATGCTSANDELADQYRSGENLNYISGDGTVTEFDAEERQEPVTFEGVVEDGSEVSSEDYAGEVLVVNFWYAECPPCRAEAELLEQTHQAYREQGVEFLGVNVRNQADTALAFSRTFGITYPSIMDADTGSAQLAFAGTVAPNAVPTTLILDRKGRVAARILGQVTDESTFNTLIRDTIAED
ncbi:TlpA disulfide reductase family protein [Arenivirga flava]|uniref:Thiol-disulfide isomerase n=1 Tax=Arenivirga flava TaxID=1930060 RepID=A0AA37XC25_9MICO|nr:TlpA disulfide reductase family protein [Arenivirga flava]GMA29205.1 thiol-disulfide isomerase [Arenivirga flava]